jgi:superfamily II DNA or RNA helicase
MLESLIADPSVANVLRLRRPMVIVDEAHNAQTNLSLDTLARLNPALIVEFTATPVTPEEHKPEKGIYASVTASSAAPSDEAAAALYQKLFAPFESKLAAATSVYLAPDGILNLVPFARLKLLICRR